MSTLRSAHRRPAGKPTASPSAVRGRARVDRRVHALLGRLRPGEVAVFDQPDLDRRTAEELLQRGVAAVINAGPCLTGRYPALGAQVLADAGVPLLDTVGPGVFDAVRDGRLVQLDGDLLRDGDLVLARGCEQTAQSVATALQGARGSLQAQADSLSASASELVHRRPGLLLDPVAAPPLRTPCAGRPLVLVQRGPDDLAELHLLRRWIAEARPVLVGVDGGAAVLLEAGLRPDVLVGDPRRLPEAALAAARDLVVPEVPDGPPVPGASEQHAGAHRLACLAGGEHAGLLLAEAVGAPVVVLVGARQGLLEILEHGGAAAAASVLGRLRAGHRLVDARAVAALHRRRLALPTVLLLALAALAVVVAALSVSGEGRALLDLLRGWHGWLGQARHAAAHGWQLVRGQRAGRAAA